MLAFTIEIFCELLLLITLIAGTFLSYKPHNQFLDIIQSLVQAIKSKPIKRKYSSNITQLWKDFNKLFDKNSELDSVLFNKAIIKSHKLCEKRRCCLYSKKLHKQKNQFSRKTIGALKKWLDKERRSEAEYINKLPIICNIDFTRATKVYGYSSMALGPSISPMQLL